MLEYEWGNPSNVMLTGGDEAAAQDSDHHSRQIFNHYAAAQPFNDTLVNSTGFNPSHHHFHHPLHANNYQTHAPTQTQTHFHSLYDPRASFGASYPPPSPAMLSLDPMGGSGQSAFLVGPKSEPGSGVVEFGSRIGLNLGGRTYFSSAEDDFVNRLYRRSRGGEPGSVNSPRCQAEGCNADLTHAKHYHRRHKVCEFHSKTATVIAAGLTQRFCQQCSRFHVLSEFDNGKRSCRKRLADHNRRRRKSHSHSHPHPHPQSQSQSHQQQQQPNNNHIHGHDDHSNSKTKQENAPTSSSDHNLGRSPPDSGAHSSSSVTVAISPPRISLDCFRQRSHQTATMSSSPSTSSIFFPNG